MQSSVFTRLQMLPFFQGISRDELLRMLERAKFDFVSVESGEIILNQGFAASQLVYALSGNYRAKRIFTEEFYVVEELEAPFVFQPESLFGVSPMWNYTLTPLSDAQLLIITKHDLMTHLMDFPTYRLSFLNYLCAITDNSQIPLLQSPSYSLREHLVQFLAQRVMRQKGYKEFHIGMQLLADYLSTSRIAISRCLRQLQEEGLINVGRRNILVHEFSQLLNAK